MRELAHYTHWLAHYGSWLGAYAQTQAHRARKSGQALLHTGGFGCHLETESLSITLRAHFA